MSIMSEVNAITQQDILDALGGLPEEVKHCSLLAPRTLRAACDDYLATIAGSLIVGTVGAHRSPTQPARDNDDIQI
jgi:hypothetical protein